MDVFIVIAAGVIGGLSILLTLSGSKEKESLQKENRKLTQEVKIACRLIAKERREHEHLERKWASLVNQINRKGGQEFLDRGSMGGSKSKFSGQDLKSLITLCHPDKHKGSSLATEITQKLLEMR